MHANLFARNFAHSAIDTCRGSLIVTVAVPVCSDVKDSIAFKSDDTELKPVAMLCMLMS